MSLPVASASHPSPIKSRRLTSLSSGAQVNSQEDGFPNHIKEKLGQKKCRKIALERLDDKEGVSKDAGEIGMGPSQAS